MRRCFLCAKNEYRHIATVKGVKVYECPECELGITERYRRSKKSLYGGSGLYSFKEYQKIADRQGAKFDKIIATLRTIKDSGEVLEVGGGFGLFTKLLSEHAEYTIDVLEPHLRLRYLRKPQENIRKLKKSFELFLKRNRRKFDIIVFLDVLEHFRDPKEIATKAKALLKKDGIVLLLLPNYKSAMAGWSKKWPWWMVEDHPYHFSPKSMTKLMRQTGLIIEYFETFEDIVDFKKSLDSNFQSIRSLVERRFRKGFFLFPFLAFYYLVRPIIWYFKYGGLMLVVARKTR